MSYAERWEKIHGEKAKTYMRKPRRRKRKDKDRLWLYKNVREPVLDVGCASCVDASHFEDYTGVDVTLSFIEVAHGFGVVKAFVMDARHLEFEDKSFETVYARKMLHHQSHEDMMQMLGEMCRVGKTVYVAWGRGGEGWNKGVDYTPSYTPLYTMMRGFHHNRHDLAKIEVEYDVRFIGEGTTVTEIRKF